MRRKYLGLAIAAITAIGPASAFGGDREIAQEIMTRLKSNRDSGALKDFTLDMKVDQGIVLFRGSVTQAEQKQLVLAAAEGVEGITEVVDEVSVKANTPEAIEATPATNAKSASSLRKMLVAEAVSEPTENTYFSPAPVQQAPAQETVPGQIRTTAAVEYAAANAPSDQQVVAGVVQALGQAQKQGALKGFGVDVKCLGGVVTLTGRARNAQQRDQIVRITEAVSGVQAVDQNINLIGTPTPSSTSGIPAIPASTRMNAVSVDQFQASPAPQPIQNGVPAYPASAPIMGTPVQGTPMPMNYGGGMGAPRYDAPNLPNYAWPGYASYPNYAALTYPQQYSPTAWPYIGPFYPYPQVPLGWRKVSLEWDDGWWFLDFTDR